MKLFSRAIDGLSLLYLLVIFPVPIFWLAVHPWIGFWRRWGTRSYWLALPVWLGCDLLLLGLSPYLFSRRITWNGWTFALGLLLCGLGLWMMRQVRHDLGLRRLAGLRELAPGRYPSKLVTEGIYAHLRHPRYVEMIVTSLGLAFLSGAWGLFWMAGLMGMLVALMAPLEERELRQHFGADYEAYAQKVPRFVPRWPRPPRGSWLRA